MERIDITEIADGDVSLYTNEVAPSTPIQLIFSFSDKKTLQFCWQKTRLFFRNVGYASLEKKNWIDDVEVRFRENSKYAREFLT